jgi:hypothetical protein
MGTRSLTIFRLEKQEQELTVVYRQMDGYLEEHGRDLIQFLTENSDLEIRKLAVKFIAQFDENGVSILIEPPGTRNLDEEFIYEVYKTNNELFLRITSQWFNGKNKKICFDGLVSQCNIENLIEKNIF